MAKHLRLKDLLINLNFIIKQPINGRQAGLLLEHLKQKKKQKHQLDYIHIKE